MISCCVHFSQSSQCFQFLLACLLFARVRLDGMLGPGPFVALIHVFLCRSLTFFCSSLFCCTQQSICYKCNIRHSRSIQYVIIAYSRSNPFSSNYSMCCMSPSPTFTDFVSLAFFVPVVTFHACHCRCLSGRAK